jgi:hypothetical protein
LSKFVADESASPEAQVSVVDENQQQYETSESPEDIAYPFEAKIHAVNDQRQHEQPNCQRNQSKARMQCR